METATALFPFWFFAELIEIIIDALFAYSSRIDNALDANWNCLHWRSFLCDCRNLWVCIVHAFDEFWKPAIINKFPPISLILKQFIQLLFASGIIFIFCILIFNLIFAKQAREEGVKPPELFL